MKIHLPTALAGLLVCADSALAWGVAGHQIVATIAQIHLHPSTRKAVADILPEWTNGQLAKIAAWPDRVRGQYPWSGQLHYVTPLAPEHPPDSCAWSGAFKTQLNVLNAIQNYTARVALDRNDIDLRFLVHFIGDVHQPLHLTGRERGGNGDPIVFEGRHMSMHGLWDTQLIAKYLRELHNYTQPLPSRQVESALTGSIYDSYVRWIVWEGIRDWWNKDLESWLACPVDDYTGAATSAQHILGAPNNDRLGTRVSGVVCPLAWAKEPHSYNCGYVYPPDFDTTKEVPFQLSSNYVTKIKGDKLIESLLAKGGIRLAAVLNTILGDEAELQTLGLVSTDGLIAESMPEVKAAEAKVDFSWLNIF
ncbi:phospholipase C/P1 nuclease [Cystobasidium minutum MCA 4210]|uniref:phospholipase C/P1 nuclease n=1 Tax=Cystobasidium minutum MCA 4210 TaxID=1397322 RepID=UPI0034CD1B99|eukprot:jgi/Rhomi1/87551/CE87550_331